MLSLNRARVFIRRKLKVFISRQTTLDEELHEVMSAKPKYVRTTTLPTNISEIRKPDSSINLHRSDGRVPDRFYKHTLW